MYLFKIVANSLFFLLCFLFPLTIFVILMLLFQFEEAEYVIKRYRWTKNQSATRKRKWKWNQYPYIVLLLLFFMANEEKKKKFWKWVCQIFRNIRILKCPILKLKTVSRCMEKQKFKGKMLMNIKYTFSSKMSNVASLGHRMVINNEHSYFSNTTEV